MVKPATVFSASASVTTSATCAASLTHDGQTFWYCSGLTITYGGATAASLQKATLTGLKGGPITLALAVPGSVTSGGALNLDFPSALAGVDQNTDVTLSLPAMGAGNAFACASVRGYRGARQLA